VALALGLPAIAQRVFVVNMVFGIVFLSLVVQGLTMSPLVRVLGLSGRMEEEEQYERAVARSMILRRAIGELEDKMEAGRISKAIHDRVTEELHRDLAAAEKRVAELEANPHVQFAWENRTRHASLMLQKSALYELMIQGELSYDSAKDLMGEIDLAIEGLESRMVSGRGTIE
jgi:CPA1 family monovalent cation:H+ antiporter